MATLPIIYEFNKLPELKLQVNTQYLLDESQIMRDDIEKFIFNTIRKCEVNQNRHIVFTRNPEKNLSFKFKTPPLATFITYFGGSNGRLLLTKIDADKYKYKKFNNQAHIHILQLEKNIQVQIDPCSHVIICDEPDLFYIYILDYKPNIENYVSIESSTENEYSQIEITTRDFINIKEDFDYDFFNGLLYENKINQICTLKDDLKKGCLLQISCNNTIRDITTYKLDKDIDDANNGKYEYNNRFNNKHLIKNFIDPVFCDFILTHALLNVKNIPIGATMDLSKIPVLSEPILFYIHRKVLPELSLSYNIPDEYIVNVKLVTLTDTTNAEQLSIMCKFTRFITIDILLSNNNCRGAYTHNFVDNTGVSLSTGDLIMYHTNRLTNYKKNSDIMYLLSIYVDVFSLHRLEQCIY